MKYRLKIQQGDVFGKLTIINRIENSKNGDAVYFCKCECGNDKKAIAHQLKAGKIYSCGCWTKPRKTKHGYATKENIRPEYTCWLNIKKRCFDVTNKYYHNYGAKGITICDEWLDFNKFIADMGDHPFKRATIERNNNLLGYNKDNCRWATYKEQGHNRCTNRVIEFMGERTIPTDWLPLLPIHRTALYRRLDEGKTIEQILKEFNLNIIMENGKLKKTSMSLSELFEVIQRRFFLINYAKINPNSGINHRFTGRGTNEKDKKTGLTEDDKAGIKAGLISLVEDINNVIEIL